jgi:hypothetical protein
MWEETVFVNIFQMFIVFLEVFNPLRYHLSSSNYTQRVYPIREEEEEEEEEDFANLLFGAVDIMTFSQFQPQ